MAKYSQLFIPEELADLIKTLGYKDIVEFDDRVKLVLVEGLMRIVEHNENMVDIKLFDSYLDKLLKELDKYDTS